MAEYAPQQHHQDRREEDAPADEVDQAAVDAQRATAEEAGEEIDTLLDEIDDVLEENAEEFVRAYVQKGGQ